MSRTFNFIAVEVRFYLYRERKKSRSIAFCLIHLIILVHVKLDIKRCQLTLLNIVKSTANKIQHFILKTTHVHATTVMKT